MAISRREARMGFELLDDDTSESEQEHFTLSPVSSNNNKKKSKEKHNWSPRRRSDQRCCSVSLGLLYLLVVILCACVGVLSVYTYSLRTNLQDLQAKVERFSEQAASSVQITAPQSLQQVVKKQQVLESNLHRLQDVSLVKLQQNISQLFSQILVLNASVTSVMKQSSPDALQQPENKELMQSIATLGSTQHSLQAEVAKLTSLPDIVSSQADRIQMIDSSLDEINNTVIANSNHINYLLNKTDSLELRFSLLDAKPGMSLPTNTNSMIQDAIHNSLKEFLKNLSLPRNVAGDISRLDNVVNNIQGDIYTINMSLSNDIIQVSKDLMLTTVRLDDRITNLVRNLSSFRNISAAVVKELNDSISLLSRRVDDLTSTRPVTQPKSESLSRLILSSIRPAAMNPMPTQAPPEKGNAQAMMPTQAPPEKGNAQALMPTEAPPEKGNVQPMMPAPESPESGSAQTLVPVQETFEKGGAQKDNVTTKSAPVTYINIPGINSIKDVDDHFEPNQKLSYDELAALYPAPYLTPEIFDQFDKDKDGALSRDELLSALGIQEIDYPEYN